MAKRRPVIGIAARTFRTRLFGEQTSYLRGIIKIAARKGMTGYVFGPRDVDWVNRRVRGWTPRARGWQRRWFSLPDVVYDRAWGLDHEQGLVHKALLARFEQSGIPHFNPDFGDKLDVYDLLASSERVAPHLPESLPLSADNVRWLGGKYPVLYIKPARGRQGKGIRTCRRSKDGWRLKRMAVKGWTTHMYSSEEAIVAACQRGENDDRFLVQQGLDLVKIAGGTVDIRVIAQRNRRGEWGVSAVGVRAGKPGGFVSNLHAGGRALSLPNLARRARLKQPVSRLQKAIAAVALDAARAMSARYPTLGELGIDIGLDTHGRVWILEINRQPGRALFSRARLTRAWRRSRLRVVEYAKFLASSRMEDESLTDPVR